MDLKEVKKFITLAKKEGVSSLSYEAEGVKISVKLPVDGTTVYTERPIVTHSSTQNDAPKVKKASGDHEVSAPFVGTFYNSPAPDEPAYVQVGSKVNKGDTLCILEAMKIMNEIEADVSGEITEICIENEGFVEYGQVLFRIKTL